MLVLFEFWFGAMMNSVGMNSKTLALKLEGGSFQNVVQRYSKNLYMEARLKCKVGLSFTAVVCDLLGYGFGCYTLLM